MNTFFRVVIGVLLLVANTVAAQNLVPNPSFEDTVSCPTGLADFSVAEWSSPSWGSPDFFHTCNENTVGVPNNAFGWQNARTGDAYVGFLTSDFEINEYREYVQCQLNAPLIGGASYEVSFFVSRTDSCTKACDNIGAYVSLFAIAMEGNQSIPIVPQVVSPLNNPIADAFGWTQVIDTISAMGGEQYLTMGVFSDNMETNWISVDGGWEQEAHYYLDDVSVVQVFPTGLNSMGNTQFSVFPNPSNGMFEVHADETILSCVVRSCIGNTILSLQPNASRFQINLRNQKPGTFFICIQTASETIVRELIII